MKRLRVAELAVALIVLAVVAMLIVPLPRLLIDLLVTLNLGTTNGITPGSLFVLYKVLYPSVPSPRVVLGEAVAVAVRDRTTTVRILNSNDAIMNGDKAELQ